MPDRGEEDVAAGLVRLGLDREADVVALVGDVVAEQVHGLAVPLEGLADVLRGVVLRTLAPAPHDKRLGAEGRCEVEVAEHLAQREAAHVAVVRGEAAVLEDGSREEVRRDHRNDKPRRIQCPAEAGDLRVAHLVGGAEGEEVVVVERESVGPGLGELLNNVHHVEVGARRATKRVGPVVADGPQTKGELVCGGGSQRHESPF